MKVLLVEDNEMNRDMLSRRLVRNGFEVVGDRFYQVGASRQVKAQGFFRHARKVQT